MGRKISNASSGENTSPNGTEKFPLTGSQWIYLSSVAVYIAEYVRTLTQTLTGKTIDLTDNTLTGTTAEFNAALSDNNFATQAGAETLTNKTLASPIVSDFSNANHDHSGAAGGGLVDHLNLTNAGTSQHVPAYSSDSTTYLDGNGNWTVPPGGLSSVYDSDIIFADNTVNNSSSDAHGFLPKLNGDTSSFLNGGGAWAVPPGTGTVYDSDIVFSDITTNNADSDMHGFLPKLNGDSNYYLNGTGGWTTPPAGGTVYDSDVVFSDVTANNASSDEHGYLPKLSGDSNTWLDGKGAWTAPPGGASFTPAFGIVTRAANASAGSDYTTTSSTFVDVDGTNLVITLTTGAHRCRVHVTATGGNDTNGGSVAVDIDVDGSRIGGTQGFFHTVPTLTNNQNISLVLVTDVLSAASHTFKVQYSNLGGGGTARLRASSNQHLVFWVEELNISS